MSGVSSEPATFWSAQQRKPMVRFRPPVWSMYEPRLQAALVTIVFYVSVALTGWLVLVVALFNNQRRTLHDYLCGTIVINDLRWTPAPAPHA